MRQYIYLLQKFFLSNNQTHSITILCKGFFKMDFSYHHCIYYNNLQINYLNNIFKIIFLIKFFKCFINISLIIIVRIKFDLELIYKNCHISKIYYKINL